MADAMTTLVLMAFGGGLGSVLRAVLSGRVARYAHPAVGVFVVNLSGSLLIGCAWSVLATTNGQYDTIFQDFYFQIFALGVLGGYTTVSSFALQTFELWQSDRRGAAVFNSIGSVLACPGVAVFGAWVAAAVLGGGTL